MGVKNDDLQTEDLDAFDDVRQSADDWKLTTTPYDPRPVEDSARKGIAFSLIGLLVGLCLLAYISIWLKCLNVEEAIKLLQVMLGPVIALVSASTGFYYGTKTSRSDDG